MLFWGLTALMLACAGVVFFALPRLQATNEPATAAAPSAPAGRAAAETALSSDPDPIPDPSLRREAEQALAGYEQALEELRASGVAHWGGEPLAQAESQAQEGQTAFVNRDYPAATQGYAEAKQRLDGLKQRIPQILTQALTAGAEALKAGDRPAAEVQFKLALAVDPDNAQAAAGLERAGNLERLRELLAAGKTSEQQDDLQAAKQSYEAALALDPESGLARKRLARVQAELTERRFQAALSAGYTAISDQDFTQAKAAFVQALKLKPGAAQAQEGLAEAKAGHRLQRIAALRRQGAEFENQERWSQAAETYAAALAIDPNLIFASHGKARAEARAQLDKQLAFHLDNPERLYSQAVYDDAVALLEQARDIDEPGPQLTKQLARLEQALNRAATPIAVKLVSDNRTQVVIYKVGELGSFENHELALRPGTYTVVGRCDGYRDVRRRFTVTAEAPPDPVVVRCEERI